MSLCKQCGKKVSLFRINIFGLCPNCVKKNKPQAYPQTSVSASTKKLSADEYYKLVDKYEDALCDLDFDSSETLNKNQAIYDKKLTSLNALKELCYSNGSSAITFFNDFHAKDYDEIEKEFKDTRLECFEIEIEHKIEKLVFQKEKSYDQNRKVYDKKISLCNELSKYCIDNSREIPYDYKQQIDDEYHEFLKEKEKYDAFIVDGKIVEKALLKYPEGILQKDFLKNEGLTHFESKYINSLTDKLVFDGKIIKTKCGNYHFIKSLPQDTDTYKIPEVSSATRRGDYVMDFGRCHIIKAWSDWDDSIHANEAQILRQGRAMTYPFDFNINNKTKTAQFSSTSALPHYDTSLAECNCGDFQERKLPCKHIYRLAVELGIIEIIHRAPGGYDKSKIAAIKNSLDVDNDPDQVKRQESAMDKKCNPTEINFNNKTAIFVGSGKNPYETTIDSCTCRDFYVRKLPCKHIYRLRHELNKNK